MTPQIKAFGLFVAINLVVFGVFVWVALSTRRPHESVKGSILRWRGWGFGVLTGGLLLALLLTLPRSSYPQHGRKPDRVVYAVGMQYSWSLSDQPIKSPEEWREESYAPPVEIPAGSLVEFQVTSFDVNHGFGVYSPSGKLLGDVQAMPGYFNLLRLRFTMPGTYRVLCLELCGMGHHRMWGEFEVVGGASKSLAATPIAKVKTSAGSGS
ncbi:MAG TPA: hypothetical protein VFL79_04520 [Terriglobia bacterium]|nr:hypothetical protein [Terriglobia bacterium]